MKSKFLFALSICILVAGCAKNYSPIMANPQNPKEIALTPGLRKMIALAVFKRNSNNVTFTHAEIAIEKKLSLLNSEQSTCVRWKGTTSDGKTIERTTESKFLNGRVLGSREWGWADPCGKFILPGHYGPFPELLGVQKEWKKLGGR
jgi:hypothetical protein